MGRSKLVLKVIQFVFMVHAAFCFVVMTSTAFGRTNQQLASSPVPDPLLRNEVWFQMLHMGNAWSVATGKGVTIAACAPGYYLQESELRPNILFEYRWDTSARDTTVDDGKFTFHGTAAVAIMAGALNGTGTNGIAFDAKIIPLQNYNYDADLDRRDKEISTAECVQRTILTGKAKVLVILNQTPQGSSETFKDTRDAVGRAIENGIVVVSAAGDSSRELLIENEMDQGSVIVGALRQNGSAANFSNYGRRITVSAVGESVYTLGGPDGRMRNFGGTAAAAAQVAGVVALALEANPRLTPRQVRSLLIETRVVSSNNMAVGGKIDAEAFVKKSVFARSDVTSSRRVQSRSRYSRHCGMKRRVGPLHHH